MPEHNPHILVFDSGLGGLSIVGHIRQQLPHCTISYLADNAFFPYGLLGEDALIDRVCTLITQLSQQLHFDAIVIACNSASTLVLPALRELLRIPIVGVVPAIKPAAERSTSKVIGLLATPGTIRRDYTDDLISEFASGCEVIRVGSSELVTLVEDKLSGSKIDRERYKKIMTPFLEHSLGPQIDTMVLACTHFPLVQQQLSEAVPTISNWVDSGAAIARRVHSVLNNAGIDDLGRSPDNEARVFLTNKGNTGQAIIETFKKSGFNNIVVI